MRKGTRICRCQHKKGTHQSKENINSSAMNGSRLGRGRAGRLAILSGATVCSLLLIYLYHSTSSEMARIRDLHVECAQQQEALATKFQVLYEYRVKLENALSNEKSANAAAKEELQQKASRERSLRDKDSLEAMQRFNSLQQNYKQLQAEQQDLKDDCKNKETAALESAKKLESTLQDLRIQLKKADEDKEKSMQHLKIKYTQLISEKEELEEKYNSLKKSVSEDNGLKARLQKQIMQLQRQLSDKISPHFSVGDFLQDSQVQPRQADVETIGDTNGVDKRAALDNNPIPLARTSSKQQVSRPSNELEAGENPQPLQAPENNRNLDNTDRDHDSNNNKDNNNDKLVNNNANNHVDSRNDDAFPNEIKSDVRFESRNGNIVPVGPNDMQVDQYAALPNPLPYQRETDQKLSIKKEDNLDAQQAKQVLAPPNDVGNAGDAKKEAVNVLSSKSPIMVPILRPQNTGEQLGQVDSEQNIPARDPNDFD